MMKNVFDFAKYFMKKGLDTAPNTIDGNMKLQKLLTFATLISMAKGEGRLFSEEILAFKNGCVIESVRLRYRNDYSGFKKDSENFNQYFSEEEYDTLNKTIGIFGNLSAAELSELNHQFDFWKNAFEKGTGQNGYHHQGQSAISDADIEAELEKIRDVLAAYEKTQQDNIRSEVINGIKYYFAPDFVLTEKIIEELEIFSKEADEDVYSIYMDEGELVIY